VSLEPLQSLSAIYEGLKERHNLQDEVEDSDVPKISWQRRALTGMMYDEFDNHLPSHVLRKR
jgi:hypothetical protein